MVIEFPYSGFAGRPALAKRRGDKFNIGVVGNSHIASFSLGWDRLKDEFPSIALTFFGGIKGTISKLQVDRDMLVPTTPRAREALVWTSGGLDHIPGNMDAYLVVGMRFSFPHVLEFVRKHRTLDIYDADENHHLVSESFLRAGLDDMVFANGSAAVMIGQLRQITEAPITLIPAPYMTTEVLTDPPYAKFWGQETLRLFAWRIYRDEIERTRKTIAVVEQPASTVIDDMFTRPEYRRGAIRLVEGLSTEHKERDYRHMNANFGAVCLGQILAKDPTDKR